MRNLVIKHNTVLLNGVDITGWLGRLSLEFVYDSEHTSGIEVTTKQTDDDKFFPQILGAPRSTLKP